MFNTHSNYGVNAELINANANANVNVVNVTNQGSNQTIYPTLQNTSSPDLQVELNQKERKDQFLRSVGVAGLVGYTLYGVSQAVKKKSPVWAVASVAPAFVIYKVMEGFGGDMFGTRSSRVSGQKTTSSGPIVGGLKTPSYAG